MRRSSKRSPAFGSLALRNVVLRPWQAVYSGREVQIPARRDWTLAWAFFVCFAFALPTANAAPKPSTQKEPSKAPVIPKPDFPIAETLTEPQRQVGNAAQQLIRDGKTREAVSAVRQLQTNIRKTNKGRSAKHPISEGLAAEIANQNKRPDLALSYAGPFTLDRTKYGSTYFNCYLQTAYAQLGLKQSDEAFRLFDWLAEKENESYGLSRILAVEGVGLVHLTKEDWGKAEQAFKFALGDLANAVREDGSYLSKAEFAYAKVIKRRIRGHQKKATDALFLKKVGPIFILYRKAQALRLNKKKNYLAAFKKYGELIKKYPDSTYAEASRLYSGLCMIEVGGYESGEKYLSAFIADDEFGLYRGEALLQLGRLALEKRLDQEKATDYFTRLDTWIKEVRTDKHPVELVDVLPGAMKEIAPPKVEKTKNFWDNIKSERVQPDDLINRVSSDWYLDNLEEQAMKFIGFLHIVDGEKEKAIAALDRILELDEFIRQQQASGQWNDYRRLKAGAGYGYFVAYPQELELYDKRQRFVIMLGDFYYITQRYSEAFGLFHAVLDGDLGRLTTKQEDYIHYALSQCVHRGRSTIGVPAKLSAMEYLKKVLERREGTWTEYRAMFEIMSLLRMSSDKAVLARSRGMLEELANSSMNNQYSHQAKLLRSLDIFYEEKLEEAKRLLRKMPKDNAVYHKKAQYYIQSIDDPTSKLWKILGPSSKPKVDADKS